MPESCPAPPEDTAAKSPLDKPLHLLTEDDIAQVTREDCRRYLKEKGMRRPSWNKSQAIQQVIMLKTLLETTPDSDAAGARKRLRISRPDNTDSSSNVALESVRNSPSVPRGTIGDAENSLSAEETTPHSVKDLDKPDFSGGLSSSFAAGNDESTQPRTPGSTNMPIGQMTIFYCGKVNVYDDVPADKVLKLLLLYLEVQALMHIAASPLRFPDEHPVDGAAGLQPLPCIPKTVSSARQDSAVLMLPTANLKNASSDAVYSCPIMISTFGVNGFRNSWKMKMNESTRLPGEENKLLQEETPRIAWKDHQPEKHLFKDTLRREKTGEGLRARERQEWPCVQA
ncbi:hypothetical protein SASPL_137663 [Salvia splendens]|uniref:Protein TIFY n=1 Tax=Salvia splendens TaxID=180675 RepID=A0A8X8WUT5_SALSN|nr:hypothetical protein SASPL_137663 [Salvia splendens]